MRSILLGVLLFSFSALAQNAAQKFYENFGQDKQIAAATASAIETAESSGEAVLATFPSKKIKLADGTTAVPAIAYEPQDKVKLLSGVTISLFGFHVEKSREEATEDDQSVLFGIGPALGVLMFNDRVEPYAQYLFLKGSGNRGRIGGRLYLHRANTKGATVEEPSGAVYFFGESSPGTAKTDKPDVNYSAGFGFHAFSDEDEGFAKGFRLELGRTFYKPQAGIKSSGYRVFVGFVVQGN